MSNLYSFCSEGRSAAAEVDMYLEKNTRLPLAGSIKTRVFVPPPSQLSAKAIPVQA